MIKAVIFDLDDTIVNTTEVSKKVIKEVYAENIDKFNGKSVNDVYNTASKVFQELISKDEIPSPSAAILVWFGIFEEFKIKPSIKDIVSLRKQMVNKFTKNVKCISNIKNVLVYLRKNHIKVGVLTNGDFMQQAQKLIKVGLDDKIDYFAGTDMAIAEKPDPKAFHFILKKLYVKPQEAIMVGDDLKADILGAINVGMKGIFYRSGWRNYTEKEEEQADLIINDLTEVIEYIKLLNRK